MQLEIQVLATTDQKHGHHLYWLILSTAEKCLLAPPCCQLCIRHFFCWCLPSGYILSHLFLGADQKSWLCSFDSFCHMSLRLPGFCFSTNFNLLPLFWSRRLMMTQWPYKWRSSKGWRTMPKGGCSKTPQQEEFSLSNDMVEKQTGKKVTFGLVLLFSSSLPPALPPPSLSLTLTFLSFLPSSPFLILTLSNPCPALLLTFTYPQHIHCV